MVADAEVWDEGGGRVVMESAGSSVAGGGARVARAIRVEVIPALCRAHGKCSRLAPEVFGHDENGFAVVKLEEIPPELVDGARKAVYACPSKALLITSG